MADNFNNTVTNNANKVENNRLLEVAQNEANVAAAAAEDRQREEEQRQREAHLQNQQAPQQTPQENPQLAELVRLDNTNRRNQVPESPH